MQRSKLAVTWVIQVCQRREQVRHTCSRLPGSTFGWVLMKLLMRCRISKKNPEIISNNILTLGLLKMSICYTLLERLRLRERETDRERERETDREIIEDQYIQVTD